MVISPSVVRRKNSLGYCDVENNIGGAFHEFSYENLRITTYDYDGSYVSIEIN